MGDFLESKFKYSSDRFTILDSMIDDNNLAGSYLARVKKKYSEYFNTQDSVSLSKFYIRWYKAKKLIYASAQMFVDADCVKNADCVVAHYFLLYYSLLHAMQANLMIDIGTNDDLVIQLSHEKIKDDFKALFCMSKGLLHNSVIIEDIEKLRNLRELYSYAMPFNVTEESFCDIEQIKEHILACFELFNLHCMIIRTSTSFDAEIGPNFSELKSYLFSLCNRIKEDDFEDEADKDFWSEFEQYGGQIEPLSIVYDHDYDEYGTYDCEIKEKLGFPTTYKRLSAGLDFVYSSF